MNATQQKKVLWLSLLVILACCSCSSKNQENGDKSRLEMGRFRMAINLYRLHVSEYPTTQQGLQALLEPPPNLSNPHKWRGPYFDDLIPLDPWGHLYQYELSEPDKYRLWSMGPDGVSGTTDDIGP